VHRQQTCDLFDWHPAIGIRQYAESHRTRCPLAENEAFGPEGDILFLCTHRKGLLLSVNQLDLTVFSPGQGGGPICWTIEDFLK
jgi:hypothetical protein